MMTHQCIQVWYPRIPFHYIFALVAASFMDSDYCRTYRWIQLFFHSNQDPGEVEASILD